MKITSDLSKVFLTSDHHFGHANIIEYCKRPFADAAEMDAALIENWNSTVGRSDTVFHLGDFTLQGKAAAYTYFQQLSGRIQMLRYPWHHDRRWLPRDDVIVMTSRHTVSWLDPLVVLEIPKLGKDGHSLAVTLCHYPLAQWDRKHHGGLHCFGHCHGSYEPPAGEYALDVGVDCMNFAPISLADAIEIVYKGEG
ncbi:MAG: hypothetical protein ACYTEQ_11710 [Planctomycetota bacterium]|jgi:calcineurin-like phosphoesterase family protein